MPSKVEPQFVISQIPGNLQPFAIRLAEQLAFTNDDLNQLFLSSGEDTAGDAPTNNPSPTGITTTLDNDGSMHVTLTWDYTDGVVAADVIVLFWKQGTGPLSIPTTSDNAVGLIATARSFTFLGLNPALNYRFGVAAARRPTATSGFIAGTIQSPTSAPDWADINGVGNYSAQIVGVAASTVVANAADGKTAFDGTPNYRSTGAPTNAASPTGFSSTVNTDGSVDYAIQWDYTQGAKKADGFFVFVLQGNSAPTTTDPHFLVGEVDSPVKFTLKGAPSDVVYSFGVAAFRRTDNAIEIGAIQSPTSSPDWRGVSTGTPSYLGSIFGVEQHNFFTEIYGTNGAPATTVLTKDGAAATWAAANSGYPLTTANTWSVWIYNLDTKAVEYAHTYGFAVNAGLAPDANKLAYTTVGSGVAAIVAGQFGLAARFTIPTAVTDDAYRSTKAASATYATLKWIEFWFRRNGNPASVCNLLGIDNTSGTSFGAIQLLSSGLVRAQAVTSGSVTISCDSVSSVTDNEWHHIAAGIDASNDLVLLIDGVLEGLAAATLTTFSDHIASAKLHLNRRAPGAVNSVAGVHDFDELLVATTAIRSTGGFTLPTLQFGDNQEATATVWQFEQPAVRDSVSTHYSQEAFASCLAAWEVRQTAALGTYVAVVRGGLASHTNQTVDTDWLDQMTRWGSTRAVLGADVYQDGAAYILVGQPALGEGNGIEVYAGKTADATDAYAAIAFQTQDSKVLSLAGIGWHPSNAPGVPDNSPTGLGITHTTSASGERQHKLTWSYTQPDLTGDNLLADGFIIYYQNTNTSNPTGQQIKLAAAARDVTFAWSLPAGAVVSYAIAAFRKTSNGEEVQTKTTTGSWQNVTASLYVQSLDPGEPTNSPTSLGITNTTIATGARTHRLSWSYSQGALEADGFILYWDDTNTSNPTEQQLTLDANVTAFTFEWALASGSVVSYAIAPFRRTVDGIEVKSKTTTGAWQNVAADYQVQTAGIATDAVTTVKITDANVTTAKRQSANTDSGSVNVSANSSADANIGSGVTGSNLTTMFISKANLFTATWNDAAGSTGCRVGVPQRHASIATQFAVHFWNGWNSTWSANWEISYW